MRADMDTRNRDESCGCPYLVHVVRVHSEFVVRVAEGFRSRPTWTAT
jgi:hypothetical protein